MRWPIRLQIFLPFAGLLLIAVTTSAVTSAWLSVRRSEAAEVQQLTRVASSLDAATFPYTAAVLARLRGLSGAEFVVVDGNGGVMSSTFGPLAELPELALAPILLDSTTSLSMFPTVSIAQQAYYAAAVETRLSGGARRLYVLYPQAAWQQRQWEAAWPPLAIGGLTLLLMLLVSGWIATRFARRIATVRDLFSELQAGRYPRLRPSGVRDELATLIESANDLSARLEELQGEIARTERLRILAQLAGGFAHQLRNALTGARMAIQLHQRECEQATDDDSLTVALAQMKLTEQQVQGLLSLSRDQSLPPQPGDLTSVLSEVAQLVGPYVVHRRIQFDCRERLAAPYHLSNADALRGALLNLVLNAIEAAGIGGNVDVQATGDSTGIRIDVADNGPGVNASVQDRLGEPFVTTKPEGVGLGVLLAQQAAREHGGELTWSHECGRTRFSISLPPRSSMSGAGANVADDPDPVALPASRRPGHKYVNRAAGPDSERNAVVER